MGKKCFGKVSGSAQPREVTAHWTSTEHSADSTAIMSTSLFRWSEMNQYSERLIWTVESTVPVWLRSSFDRIVSSQGLEAAVDSKLRDQEIGRAVDWLMSELRDLLGSEPWEQRRNPLDLLRQSTVSVSRELERLGARPVVRDEFEERSFPDDMFALCPATWIDVHPDLHEVGLEWGAWKAAAIISRRRTTEERSDLP